MGRSKRKDTKRGKKLMTTDEYYKDMVDNGFIDEDGTPLTLAMGWIAITRFTYVN